MKKSGKKFGSDFAKIDAHIIQPHEYDDAPLLTDDMLSRMVYKRNGKVIGRPKLASPKQTATFRLAADLLSHIKATGRGYNARVETVLRQAMVEGRL